MDVRRSSPAALALDTSACSQMHAVTLNMSRAPEQTDSEFESTGSHTDVWGFATTILHLATGQLPYQGLHPHQVLMAMIKRRPPAVPDTLPEWMRHLLESCLTFDPAARPTVAQLLQASLPLKSIP